MDRHDAEHHRAADAAWEMLLRAGVSMIQTDAPEALLHYRSRGRLASRIAGGRNAATAP
ncbi:hypothetical protein [Sphingomonas morindae]|uniref:Uncharacterized protein n=1 Tax=Sphingomonas morindae TaxID=1541170 RepID=A0ABY4X9V7_9SPHN|nr:hypothetical protein [Sphingomonas morindae]USI73490.1 hypothetical protein LHA26_03130 [Sphingomonas morindae]